MEAEDAGTWLFARDDDAAGQTLGDDRDCRCQVCPFLSSLPSAAFYLFFCYFTSSSFFLDGWGFNEVGVTTGLK